MAPNDTSLYVGETLTLSCVAYGLPLPTITWMRGDQPLDALFLLHESEIVTTHVTFVRSTLQLCSLRLTDEDQYVCTAANNFSSASETFTLRMKGNNSMLIASVYSISQNTLILITYL